MSLARSLPGKPPASLLIIYFKVQSVSSNTTAVISVDIIAQRAELVISREATMIRIEAVSFDTVATVEKAQDYLTRNIQHYGWSARQPHSNAWPHD
jgi:hypothetical protein